MNTKRVVLSQYDPLCRFTLFLDKLHNVHAVIMSHPR